MVTGGPVTCVHRYSSARALRDPSMVATPPRRTVWSTPASAVGAGAGCVGSGATTLTVTTTGWLVPAGAADHQLEGDRALVRSGRVERRDGCVRAAQRDPVRVGDRHLDGRGLGARRPV